MNSAVKNEFFRWIGGLGPSKLSEIDKKLLNLFVDHFETLEPLTTVKGVKNRAARLNEPIQAHDATVSSVFSDVIYLSTDIERFNRIADNESAVQKLHDDTLKKIAIKLTEKLRKSVTIDWRNKESVKATMTIRREVKRVLRKYKYPLDRKAKDVELVLEQATVLSDGWALG